MLKSTYSITFEASVVLFAEFNNDSNASDHIYPSCGQYYCVNIYVGCLYFVICVSNLSSFRKIFNGFIVVNV